MLTEGGRPEQDPRVGEGRPIRDRARRPDHHERRTGSDWRGRRDRPDALPNRVPVGYHRRIRNRAAACHRAGRGLEAGTRLAAGGLGPMVVHDRGCGRQRSACARRRPHSPLWRARLRPALSPLTNSMPVLRHRLHEGGGPIDLLMAWVSVPDLAVYASAQRYTFIRAEPGSRIVRFESLDSSFVADLRFDEDGHRLPRARPPRGVGVSVAAPARQ